MRRRYLPFDDLPAGPFAALPGELRSRELFEAGEWVNFVVDAAVVEVLGEVGLKRGELAELVGAGESGRSEGSGESPASGTAGARRASAVRQARRLGIASDRVPCFVWMLDWLGDPERSVGLGALRELSLDDLPGLEEAARRAVRAHARVQPSTDLIALAASSYPAFLRGEDGGDRLLFQPRSLGLWERFFSNEHRVVEGLNRLGAHAVDVRAGSRRDLRILELGGGLGSAAAALLQRLGNSVARYSFTDIAPGFLRRARELLLQRQPAVAVDFALLDINRPNPQQRLEGGRYDIIYSVNVLHLARDLVWTLETFRELLVPGGSMVFVEGVRPRPERPIAAEFTFQLLPQFRAVSTRADCRPHPGFLAASHWRRALELAGFSRVHTIPDFEPAVRVYPNQYMAAFVADR